MKDPGDEEEAAMRGRGTRRRGDQICCFNIESPHHRVTASPSHRVTESAASPRSSLIPHPSALIPPPSSFRLPPFAFILVLPLPRPLFNALADELAEILELARAFFPKLAE